MNGNGFKEIKVGGSEVQVEGKSVVLAVGGAIGLTLGLVAAHLFNRAAEESGEPVLSHKLKTSDIFRIALAAIALIRQISSLGAESHRSQN